MRTRRMSEATKKKISDKLRGRRKSDIARARISDGMRRHWSTVPYENNDTHKNND